MEWLLTIFALCVPLFMLGGCACCGTPCTTCAGGSSTHTQVQAVVVGLGASSCVSCGLLNGTYILDQVLPTFPCHWEATVSTTCNFTRVFVFLQGGEVTGGFLTPAGTSGYAWHENGSGYDNCDWSSFPINDSVIATLTTACNTTVATFTITAL